MRAGCRCTGRAGSGQPQRRTQSNAWTCGLPYPGRNWPWTCATCRPRRGIGHPISQPDRYDVTCKTMAITCVSDSGYGLVGTATMRTGGDDIAQAMALMGVRPVWATGSQRVDDFEILPLSLLDRPAST